MPDASSLHPRLQRIHTALVARPGRPARVEGTPARAAVALAFRDAGDDVELLMIRRAERQGDPWSGQVALPGGRFDPSDPTLLDTAIRETWEETSVDLRVMGRALGTLDELHPRTPVLPSIVVSPYVFALTGMPELALSGEVAEAFWVPLATLQSPSVRRESEVSARGQVWRVNSLVVREHVIWGMTERILQSLLIHVG